jgi:hypothetical protein
MAARLNRPFSLPPPFRREQQGRAPHPWPVHRDAEPQRHHSGDADWVSLASTSENHWTATTAAATTSPPPRRPHSRTPPTRASPPTHQQNSVQKRLAALAATTARRASQDRAGAAAGRALLAADEAELAAFKVEHVLGEDQAPERDDLVRIASYDGAAAPAAAPAPRRHRPPRGAVVVVSQRLDAKGAARAMGAAPGVASVVEDRWITVAQAKIGEPRSLFHVRCCCRCAFAVVLEQLVVVGLSVFLLVGI